MRRSEFSSTRESELQIIAARCEVGYLGIIDDDGYPRVVPLNFVLRKDSIYFHGAEEGQKYEVLRKNPKVTFSIVEPYSIIPSYWIAREYACPATAFFKSIYIKGEACLVHGLKEKAEALQALMEKYQPEGNYRPITAEDPLYIKPLQSVSVFKIVPTNVDMKFKFGQNFNAKKRLDLIRRLEERNSKIDVLTAAEIRKSLTDT